MRNLIDFILKNISWFVFILLELVCFYLIFNNNAYQRSIFLSSSHEITGRIYSVSGEVSSYFGLRQQNQDLLERNAQLQNEIFSLKEYINDHLADSISIQAFVKDSLGRETSSDYEIILAKVINNSINQINNFIYIKKGSNDGVKEDVGVISEKGIVGVVRAVSPNFSIIQPILNPDTKFNCRVLNTNTTGTLIWEGNDPRYATLIDYPKYEKITKGDTIVTSGFSGIFPEGILVGTVGDISSQKNDNNFVNLSVKLSTDFSSLKDVLLIRNKSVEELRNLEKRVKDVKK